MTNKSEWIALSQALSWIAFGKKDDKDKLKKRLAQSNYSAENLFALENGLEKLISKVSNGTIKLIGKCVSRGVDSDEAALTENIPPEKMHDFSAFDITTDGLRHGQGLMWLPGMANEAQHDLRYTFRPMLRLEHYIDVKVDSAALQIEFKSGALRRLPDSLLKKWWDGLPDAEKRLGEAKHTKMLKEAFPDHHVARERLREVRGPRKRGREKKSP